MRYRNDRTGRVITRSQPDPWLDASKRWTRVEPLSPIPAPEREPEHEQEDGDPPSGEE
jgi:hypothetical protein